MPALLAVAAAPAAAQWSGSVLLVSDQRFRGVSVSDGQPELRLGLAFDAADGWYGGTSLGRVALGERRRPQWLLYAGRSLPLGAGRSLELGLTHVRHPGDDAYDYGEAFVGWLAERWQARLHVSTDYFGRGAASAYAELNLNWRLPLGLRGLAHVGALAVGHDANPHYPTRRRRTDLRLGLARGVGDGELQLAWAGAQRGGPYPYAGYDDGRGGWVLSAAWHF